ncbi:type III-A CRISPR-associated RAMP protein Csm3 [uncultured Methanosphaera sp.]|uniref:type III-A CRISPR-associated RAMP protein Csm3 n=1 Tax=uncultured Methanosphaera sp. TaxID=262501 RepID=UPI0025921A64|nr:type III-A CRISPR-associated RAMP protein Csm3 [uncultured Methanosphaera sp.]
MFIKNYIINGEITCKTGLHIGGSLETIEIGGSDNPIIKDTVSNLPFIPGSSIKGKLRSLLELSDKQSSKSVLDNGGNVSTEGIAAEFFGVANNNESSKEDNDNESSKDDNDNESSNNKFHNKLIVRDAFPTKDTIKMWKKHSDIIDGAELKYENSLHRITSKATPRNIERVPVDSKFKLEIVLSIYDETYTTKSDYESLTPLFKSMKLLQDDYLGGSGTRGFGKIEFEKITIKERGLEYYTGNTDEKNTGENVIVKNRNIDEAITKLKGKE